MAREGVAVIPSTAPDYRSLTKLLNDAKKEYHTYSLPEDKGNHLENQGLKAFSAGVAIRLLGPRGTGVVSEFENWRD